jgi:very-short-patch-repair endonuclease/transposase-like protein
MDIESMQKFYDDGNTVSEVSKTFGISERQLYKLSKKGILKFRSSSERLKLILRNNPRKHTEESKKKISRSRIKYLKENPDKVPYLLNHSSKESYPEIYFRELFLIENIEVESKFRVGLYELDFCIPSKKIDIEIDGEQHYYDDKIKESDLRRNNFLIENGWDVIRIRWKDYKKLSLEERTNFIGDLRKFILNISSLKPSIDIKKNKKGYDLCFCGGCKTIKSKLCRSCRPKKSNPPNRVKNKKKYFSFCQYCLSKCSNGRNCCQSCAKIKNRKVERPPYNELVLEIENNGYVKTGKKYGVSDNSIRKWIKFYEKNTNNNVTDSKPERSNF